MAEKQVSLPPPSIILPQLESLMQHLAIAQISQQPLLWHPDHIPNDTPGSYRSSCLARVTADMRRLLSEPQPGADVFPNSDDPTRVEFLLRGQRDTPYEGGFFHFSVRVPPEYPQLPPRAAICTTGGGQVRFNPNYYENGCVCLSILGTWHGDPWQQSYNLTNVLHSMQYQFNDLPWRNEPGFSQDLAVQWMQLYNDFLAHETLRVAVCDQLESGAGEMRPAPPSALPTKLRRRAATHFVRDFDSYVRRCQALSRRLDGKMMMIPYRPGVRNSPFNFAGILRRLEKLRKVAQRDADADTDEDGEDAVDIDE